MFIPAVPPGFQEGMIFKCSTFPIYVLLDNFMSVFIENPHMSQEVSALSLVT